jgi:hypothetical protein
MPDDMNAMIRRALGREPHSPALDADKDWLLDQLIADSLTDAQRKAWNDGADPGTVRAMKPRPTGGARDAGAIGEEQPQRQSMNEFLRGIPPGARS